MAHPYHEHRQHKVEKSRVHKLYRASGGKIPHGSEETDDFASDGEIEKDRAHRGDRGPNKGQGKSPSLHKAGGAVHGKKNKHRMDRKRGGHTKRADGGQTPAPAPQQDPYEERAKITTDTGARVGSGMRPNPNASYDSRTGKVKGFKKGGKVKGKTTINIMVGGEKPPMPPPMMPPPRPPMPPPGPPPGGPPGGPPMGGPPGMPPGGMPPPGMPRKRGGAVKGVSVAIKAPSPLQGKGGTSKAIKPAAAHPSPVHDMANPLSGARSTPGDRMPGNSPGWKQSERHKTKVQHTDGKTDGPDIGRGKPITYNRGGAVGLSTPVRPAKPLKGVGQTSKATPAAYAGGPRVSHAEPPMKEGKYPISTGGKGGEARLQKERGAGRRGAA